MTSVIVRCSVLFTDAPSLIGDGILWVTVIFILPLASVSLIRSNDVGGSSSGSI